MTRKGFIVRWILTSLFEIALATGLAAFGFNSMHLGLFFVMMAIGGCLIFMAAGANIVFGIWFLRFWDFDSESIKKIV